MICPIDRRPVLLGIAALTVAAIGLEVRGQDTNSDRAPAYPVVLRLNEVALRSLTGERVDHQGPVDEMVLGTRARGTSHTTGDVVIKLQPPGSPSLLVVQFSGGIKTTTVGRNGPAIIDSRSETTFTCTREILFDPDKGFIASPCKVDANTVLHYEGFRPARRGVGGRLVSRVAERRAMESKDEATRIVAGQHERKLAHEFDDRLNDAIRSLNRKVNVIRYAGLILPQPRELRIAVDTAPQSLEIAIGPADASDPFPTLPSIQPDSSPMELWLHASLLNEPLRGLEPLASAMKVPLLSIISAPTEPQWFVTAGQRGQQVSTALSQRSASEWFRIGFGRKRNRPDQSDVVLPQGETADHPVASEPSQTAESNTDGESAPQAQSAERHVDPIRTSVQNVEPGEFIPGLAEDADVDSPQTAKQQDHERSPAGDQQSNSNEQAQRFEPFQILDLTSRLIVITAEALR